MHPVKRNVYHVLLCGSLALLVAAPATATIIGGSVTGGSAFAAGGTFVKLTVPLANPFGTANSVGNNTFQSPNLFGFDEAQNVPVGPGDLLTDAGTNPVPAGTTVASHYIFFDPGPLQNIVGTVDFDSDIVAIITATNTLQASDYLANTGVHYLNPLLRGLEAGDSVSISGARQILFTTAANTPGDYVRVLTVFSPGPGVPEPGMGLLLAGGTGLLWMLRRRAGSHPF